MTFANEIKRDLVKEKHNYWNFNRVVISHTSDLKKIIDFTHFNDCDLYDEVSSAFKHKNNILHKIQKRLNDII